MTIRVEIVPATLDHVADLGPRLREHDRMEVFATAGLTGVEALRRSVEASAKAWAGFADGRLVCMWGVVPSAVPGVGVPWLLGSDELVRHQVAFLRRNRAYVAAMGDGFAILRNRVDARNAVSKRWLRWMGFTIEPAAPWGVLNLPFHPFWKRGNANV